MKAFLKNYRQSPRKVRLIADLIRGKKIEKAKVLLQHSIKDASAPILKLLNSAVANALNQGLNKDDLKVGEIMVNGGYTLKRMMPRARGSAFLIRKRTSNVILNLKADSLTDVNPSTGSGQVNKEEKVAKKSNKPVSESKKEDKPKKKSVETKKTKK